MVVTVGEVCMDCDNMYPQTLFGGGGWNIILICVPKICNMIVYFARKTGDFNWHSQN